MSTNPAGQAGGKAGGLGAGRGPGGRGHGSSEYPHPGKPHVVTYQLGRTRFKSIFVRPQNEQT
jgi:hypothetical protein